MKKFYIEVTETLQRIVSVEAANLEDAYEQVEEWANEGEGLTYEDFVSRDFEDRTQYCEDRDPTIRDAFFDITVRNYLTIHGFFEREIEEIYEKNPNISYDDALSKIMERQYNMTNQTFIGEYHYPNGWIGPIISIRENGIAQTVCYIAVNKRNKIQVVNSMLEVK